MHNWCRWIKILFPGFLYLNLRVLPKHSIPGPAAVALSGHARYHLSTPCCMSSQHFAVSSVTGDICPAQREFCCVNYSEHACAAVPHRRLSGCYDLRYEGRLPTSNHTASLRHLRNMVARLCANVPIPPVSFLGQYGHTIGAPPPSYVLWFCGVEPISVTV